jgi:eukaryotic-like serine/threonine-protein kinase
MAALPTTDDPRRRIAGYELLELVDRRGGVAVYRARQLAVDRVVDLTVLPPSSAAKPACLARFERTLAVTSRLRHDNVISALDAGTSAGYRYFVTEHVEGPTLAAALAAGEEFPLPRAVAVALGVARALTHLESVGIVHRGIDPRSVVLSSAELVKLTGFTSAKERSPRGAETWFDADTEAASYVSPDRVRGDRGIDSRADVYSLGCVLYRMVNGRPPFKGMSAASILDAHLARRPRDPRTIRDDLPAGLVQVLDRCLRKTPDERYVTAADLVRDLEAVAAGRRPPTPDAGRPIWPARAVRPTRTRRRH